jgi:hypothetical protein
LHLHRIHSLKPQCLKAALENILSKVAKDSQVERVCEAVIESCKELCDESSLWRVPLGHSHQIPKRVQARVPILGAYLRSALRRSSRPICIRHELLDRLYKGFPQIIGNLESDWSVAGL